MNKRQTKKAFKKDILQKHLSKKEKQVISGAYKIIDYGIKELEINL